MSKEVILKKYRFLLGASEDAMPFLDNLKKEDLNTLFLQTAEAISGGQSDIWQKLAKGSHLMPAFIAAKLSENIFGEVVCANVASYMRVKDAVQIIKHLSIDFMAKTCPHMIPEKTEELINAIPMRKTRKVTRILLKDEDYYTLARFVDTLELSKVLLIAKEDIDDERVLLRIATYVEDKALVGKIFMNFSDDRKLNLLRSAYEDGFRDELRIVMTHLSPENISHLHIIIAELPDELRQQVAGDLSIA